MLSRPMMALSRLLQQTSLLMTDQASSPRKAYSLNHSRSEGLRSQRFCWVLQPTRWVLFTVVLPVMRRCSFWRWPRHQRALQTPHWRRVWQLLIVWPFAPFRPWLLWICIRQARHNKRQHSHCQQECPAFQGWLQRWRSWSIPARSLRAAICLPQWRAWGDLQGIPRQQGLPSIWEVATTAVLGDWFSICAFIISPHRPRRRWV